MSVPAEAVASFLRARSERPHWQPVREAYRPMTIGDGYRLQKAVHEAIEAGGNPLLGYKVGSTSASGQRSFGIDEPIYAGMFENNQAASLAGAFSAPLLSPSIECEIAFCLGSDLDGRSGSLSLEHVANAVGTCHIACEVIDNRYGNPFAIGVPTLLVDDFFHTAFVIGPANPTWRELDLTDLNASTTIDGAVVRGHSADVLTPLASLRWLADKLAAVDRYLRAGDIVLSGSIVAPTPIALPARSVSLAIDGFERLEL